MIKKLLSLVLAILLVFSMGINAFAADLVVLYPTYMASAQAKMHIHLVDPVDQGIVLYTTEQGVYYIALDDMPFEDVTITAKGAILAELIEFNPETMIVEGMDIIYGITRDGEFIGDQFYDYEEAVAASKELNEAENTDSYEAVLLTNVNIIKITIEDNYSTSYIMGTLRIDATLNGKPFSSAMTVVVDVSIFEPKYVKAISDGFDEGSYLECGDYGYSDYMVDLYGYGAEYVPEDLRTYADAAVVATTTFRDIEGQNLAFECPDMELRAEIRNVAPGQKGVNFKHYSYIKGYRWGSIESICFGFKGDQVVKSDFTVRYRTGLNWYDLREAFGLRIEEDNIISYYLLKDGKVVGEYIVDYGIADTSEQVVLSYTGSNATLGKYELRIDVPAEFMMIYDANGGENGPVRQSKTFGVDEYISEEIPTRKWHTFLGWATSKDATEVEYAPGDVYSADEDVTLYAVWQEDAEAKANLSVSTGTASFGEEVHVKVDLSSTIDISVMQFAVKYDPSVLSVVSCGTGIATDALVNSSEEGIIYYVWEDTKAVLKEGTVLDIIFKVKGDATAQNTAVEIVEHTGIFEPIFMDPDMNEFRTKFENGGVNVIEIRYGDINGDGKINVIDANLVRRYSARLMDFNEGQMRVADVDGNGKVNILDANLIRKYTVKLIDKFPVAE